MILILVSITLLSITALAATTTNEINSKTSLKAPVAAFTASPKSGYASLKVAFTDKSTGIPTS
jgi:tripartite motif-containing protein 71